MKFVLQDRKNVALLDKVGLNMFSQLLAESEILKKGRKSEKDWKWKVIGLPLGIGDVHVTQPMIYLKHSYWGRVFGSFHNRLAVIVN